MTNTKVVIIGAGAMGLSMAARLGSSDIPVVVLEKAPSPQPFSGVQGRVVVLNALAQRLLTQLDVWSQLESNAGSIEQMVLEYPHSTTQGCFLNDDTAHTTLGRTVFNQAVCHALLEKCRTMPSVSLQFETCLESVQVHADHVCVNDHFTAELLVASDGAHSPVRKILNQPAYTLDYRQKALVTTIETQHAHEGRAFQWFLPQGPLAFLPLKDANLMSIVWSGPPAEALENIASLARELTVASEVVLGNVRPLSLGATFPLKAKWLESLVLPRVAWVGDAAHTIHPLAGQGMNLGFADVDVLCHHLMRAQSKQVDFGRLALLKRYAHDRNGPNRQMQEAMTAILQATAQQKGPLAAAHDGALRALHYLPTLRQWLVGIAQGE